MCKTRFRQGMILNVFVKMKKSLWHSRGKQDMEPKSMAKVMNFFHFFVYISQVEN